MDVGKEREYDLHGQIFAPAISAFTTSLWIMQEVEQCRSNCRGTKDTKFMFFLRALRVFVVKK